MNGKLFRQAMCIILALMMFGCRSAYDLTLYSQPSGLAVEISPDIQGRTPCNLELPKSSKLIHDHYIDVKYTMDDGREVVKSYDLRKYEPPSDAALFGAGLFAVPGAALLWLSLPEEDESDSFSDDEDEPYWAGVGVGLGLIAIGGLTYFALGGKSDAQSEYEIHETFE